MVVCRWNEGTLYPARIGWEARNTVHAVRSGREAPGVSPESWIADEGSYALSEVVPDGKKMVFVAQIVTYQLLLMENFLPKSEEPEKGNVTRSSR